MCCVDFDSKDTLKPTNSKSLPSIEGLQVTDPVMAGSGQISADCVLTESLGSSGDSGVTGTFDQIVQEVISEPYTREGLMDHSDISFPSDRLASRMTSVLVEDRGCCIEPLVAAEVLYDGVCYTMPCDPRSCKGVHQLSGVPIQLNPCSFFRECFCHPGGIDENATYVFEGIRDGFAIVDQDFHGSYFCSNYQSILDPEFKTQMDKTVVEELEQGKVSRVGSRPTCVHSLGAIRKSNGKLRPITDCRRPEGDSINNFMHSTCQDFTFVKLDSVADYMTDSCFFAVLDLKSAYRSVHIAPSDRTYQGFVWNLDGENQWFQDNCLSFGLRCAPYIFSRLTEFVVHCMERRGHDGIFGYLDDFLVVGSTRDECEHKLLCLIGLLRTLGFSIAWDKVVSPANVVTYLGIELDSLKMEFRLPDRKLVKIKSLVNSFKDRKKATKKELQVLAGHLAHASTVVRGGRTFSRCILNFVKYLPDGDRAVALPSWLKPDIDWWCNLMEIFNGSAKVIKSNDEVTGTVSTDSSMTGFGGLWLEDWFVGVWDPGGVDTEVIPDHHWEQEPSENDQDVNINILEL